jgi:hypothetical protein
MKVARLSYMYSTFREEGKATRIRSKLRRKQNKRKVSL